MPFSDVFQLRCLWGNGVDAGWLFAVNRSAHPTQSHCRGNWHRSGMGELGRRPGQAIKLKKGVFAWAASGPLPMTPNTVDSIKTIHPYLTLGESNGMAAEVVLGVWTDVPPVRR
jgi:hypothetical protein